MYVRNTEGQSTNLLPKAFCCQHASATSKSSGLPLRRSYQIVAFSAEMRSIKRAPLHKAYALWWTVPPTVDLRLS